MSEPLYVRGRREEAGAPPYLRGLVSRLLIGGLLIAGAFLLVGTALDLHDGVGLGSRSTAVGLTGALPAGLVDGAPSAYLFVGLVVLLATPLARVVVSVALFAAAGDRAFTGLTLFVLAVLSATIVLGAFR